jgi:hypothetical protein
MTAISVWPHKVEEPLAVGSELDYLVDWRGDGWLEDDENIVDSTWVVDGPATLLTDTNTTGVATAWIEATAAGTVRLTNSIVTDSLPLPRKDSRTLVIKLKVR